jgi:hypothetical protein
MCHQRNENQGKKFPEYIYRQWRRLRIQGLSLRAIGKISGASPGTIHIYVKDIDYQREAARNAENEIIEAREVSEAANA